MINHQDLGEQRLQLLEEWLAERSNDVVIGVGVLDNMAKGHRTINRPFDLSTGKCPGGASSKKPGPYDIGRIYIQMIPSVVNFIIY